MAEQQRRRFSFRRKAAYSEEPHVEEAPKKDPWRVRMMPSWRKNRQVKTSRYTGSRYHRIKHQQRSPTKMKFVTGSSNEDNKRAVRTARAKENRQHAINRLAAQDVRSFRSGSHRPAVGERPPTLAELREQGAKAKIKGARRMNTAQLREALGALVH